MSDRKTLFALGVLFAGCRRYEPLAAPATPEVHVEYALSLELRE